MEDHGGASSRHGVGNERASFVRGPVHAIGGAIDGVPLGGPGRSREARPRPEHVSEHGGAHGELNRSVRHHEGRACVAADGAERIGDTTTIQTTRSDQEVIGGTRSQSGITDVQQDGIGYGGSRRSGEGIGTQITCVEFEGSDAGASAEIEAHQVCQRSTHTILKVQQGAADHLDGCHVRRGGEAAGELESTAVHTDAGETGRAGKSSRCSADLTEGESPSSRAGDAAIELHGLIIAADSQPRGGCRAVVDDHRARCGGGEAIDGLRVAVEVQGGGDANRRVHRDIARFGIK